jgi:hypothetical protein
LSLTFHSINDKYLFRYSAIKRNAFDAKLLAVEISSTVPYGFLFGNVVFHLDFMELKYVKVGREEG